MEKFNQLVSLVEATKVDAEKFFTNKNSAAGTRVRKALQEIKSLSQEIRNDVTDTKNSWKK